jgi:hypothetical protein
MANQAYRMRLHAFLNSKEIKVSVFRRLGDGASRRASLLAPFWCIATHFTEYLQALNVV